MFFRYFNTLITLRSQLYIHVDSVDSVFGFLWCGIRAVCGLLQRVQMGGVVFFNFAFMCHLGMTDS